MNKESNKFNIGDLVTCTPKDLDFSEEFMGVVVDVPKKHGKHFYEVKDQDDNHFDVDEDQLQQLGLDF